MEHISLLISLLAFVGTILTYLIHERKLKTQESKINAYQLRKFEEEEREAKMAKVRANLVKGTQGKTILKVFNQGKAQARHVRLHVDETEGLHFFGNPFPLAFLNEGEHVDVYAFLTEEGGDRTTIRLEWEDDAGKDNWHEQILVL